MTAHEVSRGVPMPPPARRFSILPAASVVVLAALTLVIVGATNALDTSQVTPTTLPVILGGLPAASSSADAALFQGEVQDGVPPSDIASALIAPRGTTILSRNRTGGLGPGNYDRSTTFQVAAPRARVFGFYRSNLTALRWILLYAGVAPHDQGDDLLVHKQGSDGSFWEAGVTAQPTAHGATTFTFRIFQATDAS